MQAMTDDATGRWGGHKVVDFGAHLQRRARDNFLGSADMQLNFHKLHFVPSDNLELGFYCVEG